jgi:hypothetical protein
MYLKKKVSYEYQLTLREFLEIEMYRFQRLAVSLVLYLLSMIVLFNFFKFFKFT